MDKLNLLNPELGEQNVFEEIFELLERHRMNLEQTFPLRDFYDVVEKLDMTFQKFNLEQSNGNYIIIFNDLLNYTTKNFLVIFKAKGFRDEAIFYAFKRFLVLFMLVLQHANKHQNSKDIIRNFFDNFPSLLSDISKFKEDAQGLYTNEGIISPRQQAIIKFEKDFPFEIGIHYKEAVESETEGVVAIKDINDNVREIHVESLEGVRTIYRVTSRLPVSVKEGELVQVGTILVEGSETEKELLIYCNDYLGKTILWNDEKSSYDIVDDQFYLRLSIIIKSDIKSVEKLVSPLWLITTALEKINNVELELAELFKGSLQATIKIWMKDLLAKEETKAVLETSKEVAIKTITGGMVSYSEVKKSGQETKKLSLENRILENEINHTPSTSEINLERALDLEKKKLENEKLKIENSKAKIEIIQQLSGLAAKGLIDADMIRVEINDVLFLLKEKNEIKEIGPDIYQIS